MSNQKFISEDLQLKFNNISVQMFNFKYVFNLFKNYLEDNTDVSIEVQCLALILEGYFENLKNDYNKLEEELGVVL